MPANGRDGVLLLVRLLDREGQPLAGDTPLTLEATRGRFVAPDATDALDEAVDRVFAQPGYQALARDGVLRVRLQSPV